MQKPLLILFSLIALSQAITYPIAIFHGMGDQCINPGMKSFVKYIQDQVGSDVYVKCIEVGNGATDSLFMAFNKQVELACDGVKNDIQFQGRDISVMGLSQGNLQARHIIESCNFGGTVKRFVSLAGPHMGVATLPKCHHGFICTLINGGTKDAVYLQLVQNGFGPAGYFSNPQNQEKFIKDSIFLPDLNNQRQFKSSKKENMQKLEKLLLIKNKEDSMIDPRETAWFEFYDTDGKTVVPMQDSDIYKQDLVGLKYLDTNGIIEKVEFPGDHLNSPKEYIDKYIIPAFKGQA